MANFAPQHRTAETDPRRSCSPELAGTEGPSVASRRRRLGPAAAAAGVLLLGGLAAGCGGSDTPPHNVAHSPTPEPGAAGTTVGSLSLKLLRVERPADESHVAGTNAGLYVTIVNNARAVDQLTSVTSPDAGQVLFRQSAAGATRPATLRIAGSSTNSMQHSDGPHFELAGLKREIQRGMVVPVTFVFQRAGSVTVNVPVQVADNPKVPSPTSSPS